MTVKEYSFLECKIAIALSWKKVLIFFLAKIRKLFVHSSGDCITCTWKWPVRKKKKDTS